MEKQKNTTLAMVKNIKERLEAITSNSFTFFLNLELKSKKIMNRLQSRLGATEGRTGELETKPEENTPTKSMEKPKPGKYKRGHKNIRLEI